MPDDLRIPTPTEVARSAPAPARAPVSTSYRARRVPERGMRAMVIAAAVLGGVFVIGMGSWALMGRRPAVVPVIEADSRPVRVKPDNPGGMQFAGSDEVQGDGPSGTERMAPTAEAPAPQALRAQMQQGTADPVGAGVIAPQVAAPAGTGSSPLPDTPARAAAPARAAGPGRPAAGGGALVQLAAVGSEAEAQAEWQRLAKRMPDLLGGRRAVIQKAERDGRAVWRVRTGGFSDIAEATEFCTKLRGKGGNCAIASF